eukprot:7053694-Prymnesium_polylepis.1
MGRRRGGWGARSGREWAGDRCGRGRERWGEVAGGERGACGVDLRRSARVRRVCVDAATVLCASGLGEARRSWFAKTVVSVRVVVPHGCDGWLWLCCAHAAGRDAEVREMCTNHRTKVRGAHA